jgi:hypothetical protein
MTRPRSSDGYVPKPCRCHPACQGHHYGSDLRCQNGGCRATWETQQKKLTRCRGLWVQQQGREVDPE